jgi:hypothetical protein
MSDELPFFAYNTRPTKKAIAGAQSGWNNEY